MFKIKFEGERKVVVIWDMNTKVGNESIDEVVGKWGVDTWEE